MNKNTEPKYPYLQVRASGHPIADRRGNVVEHRKVLYDTIGAGVHPCHWCGRELHWRTRNKHNPLPDDLVVDHLDGDKRNNDPVNLVPSCQPCNVAVGFSPNRVRDDEVFKAHGGARLRGVEKACPACYQTFVTSPLYDNIYCSVVCAGAARRVSVCPQGHQKVWSEKFQRSRCETCRSEQARASYRRRKAARSGN